MIIVGGIMPEESKPKKHTDVLMVALDFDDDDLAANKSGEYSDHQIAELKRRRTWQAIIFSLTTVVVSLLALVSTTSAPTLLLPMLFFLGLFMVWSLLAGGIGVVRFTRDLRTGIKAAEGRVGLDMNPSQNTSAYFVKLDERKFKVKKAIFLAFKNGDPYRIYYAPHSKTILSVEWLRDDNPFDEELDQHGEAAPLAADEPVIRNAKRRS
jgi:hypothetical protein